MPDYQVSKVLAALLHEQGNYSFVDKLGYSPTPDLAVLYLKEALRDVHSLISGERITEEGVKELLKGVDWDEVDREIGEVAKLEDRRKLKEVVSLITAQALAISAKFAISRLNRSSGESEASAASARSSSQGGGS